MKDYIKNAIKEKFGSTCKSLLTYVKLYSQWIDNLKIYVSHQPPILQIFDDNENLKQYIAHFVETCNNVGTPGYYVVETGSIENWSRWSDNSSSIVIAKDVLWPW